MTEQHPYPDGTGTAPQDAVSPTREVTHLPPPTGANWGQIAFGLVAVVVGVGVLANQVAGFQIRSVTSTGPTALVSIGVVCALFGMLGMFRRRRR